MWVTSHDQSCANIKTSWESFENCRKDLYKYGNVCAYYGYVDTVGTYVHVAEDRERSGIYM